MWHSAVLALAANYWDHRHGGVSAFDWISAYFLKVFFIASFFRVWQIARKREIDERNHSRVIGKQEQVLARLESVGQRLEGLIDGGDSYCYISGVTSIGDKIVSADVSVVGEHALHDVRARVTASYKMLGNLQSFGKTSDRRELFKVLYEFDPVTTLPAKILAFRSCEIKLVEPQRFDLFVHWRARNGGWSQKIQGIYNDATGNWHVASRITRANETFEHGDLGFPNNSDGTFAFFRTDIEELEKMLHGGYPKADS
jgi:hypothetical protein